MPRPVIRVEEAANEAQEAASWQCESCNTFIEEYRDGPHCHHCAEYWDDVSRGLFDDWESEQWRQAGA